ncbi:hypothetical protein G1L21_14020, partial [Tenacibaculum finnmarkense]|nr:hypothetical protein [Tenacibaculum finnmarkense]
MSLIKDRVLQYIDSKGIKREGFFSKTKISYSNFRGKSKKSGLNSDTIVEISSLYPDVNPLWLLTGEGEMLKQEQPKQEVSNIDYKEKYYKVLEEKDILSQQIITLQQQLLGNT